MAAKIRIPKGWRRLKIGERETPETRFINNTDKGCDVFFPTGSSVLTNWRQCNHQQVVTELFWPRIVPLATPSTTPGTKSFSFTGYYAPMAMVERAVRYARPTRRKSARWIAVMDVLGYRSTTSRELCRHFGLDADEILKPWK